MSARLLSAGELARFLSLSFSIIHSIKHQAGMWLAYLDNWLQEQPKSKSSPQTSFGQLEEHTASGGQFQSWRGALPQFGSSSLQID